MEYFRKCISSSHPIPILVVSGPKKTVTSESIDLAELSALKILACLNERVKKHFSPGIIVNIRLEDITGLYLEEGVKGLSESMERYIGDLTKLVNILDYKFIHLIREKSLITESDFRNTSDSIFPLIFAYLKESDCANENQWENMESYKQLLKSGWKGIIPQTMRDYYDERYKRLFPGYTKEERLITIVKYLAGTLTRYKLNAIGIDNKWPGNFQINFMAPIPGAPESMTSMRLYYRTVPLSQTNRHMPFWRAKGYLRMNDGVKISLASWNENLNYTPFAIDFFNENEKVSVKADYVEER